MKRHHFKEYRCPIPGRTATVRVANFAQGLAVLQLSEGGDVASTLNCATVCIYQRLGTTTLGTSAKWLATRCPIAAAVP